MIKWLFEHYCTRLMLLNSNNYSFGSGILISIASSVLVQLCFMQFKLRLQWHLYLSVLLLYIAGAIDMYISYVLSKLNHYFEIKNTTDLDERKKTIKDTHGMKSKKWVMLYAALTITTLLGIICLIFNQYFLYSNSVEISSEPKQIEVSSYEITN